MRIKLLPEQRRWLEARVAAGEYVSREAAVQQIIADRMAIAADDLDWTKPDIDLPRPAVARSDVLSVEEAIADVDAHMASLKR
jgi:hypothetical protein